MFPLHCNKCFLQKEFDISSQFFVSKCGHILCDQCVVKTKCLLCNRVCSPMLIGKSMPSSMAAYFESPFKVYKRYQKQLKFQCEQEAIFANYHVNELPKQMLKAQNQLNGYLKLDERLNEVLESEKKRIAKLKAYLAYYERRPDDQIKDPRRSRSCSLESLGRSASQRLCNSENFLRPETPALSLPDSCSAGDNDNKLNPERGATDFTM